MIYLQTQVLKYTINRYHRINVRLVSENKTEYFSVLNTNCPIIYYQCTHLSYAFAVDLSETYTTHSP